MHDASSFIRATTDVLSGVNLMDFLDVGIVAFLLYKIFMFIRDTRAEQLFKGIILLLITTQASATFKLYTLHWILINSLQFGFIATLIIFQPELRTGLERIGRTNLKFGRTPGNQSQSGVDTAISQIADSLFELSKEKTGALIVLEKETKLSDIIKTGTKLDAIVSSQTLNNIFFPNSPMHDGAVVIRDFRIDSAGCFLPLTNRQDLSKDLGTRHRAGIGVSETSDCISLMVSEETGKVSMAKGGKLYRNLSKEAVIKTLSQEFVVESEEKGFFERWFSR